MRAHVPLALALVLFASPALADDPRAEAESLFEEGRALVAKGRYEEACPKFAESYRLEPGVGTLLNLASCYENTGRTASAWARYREAIPIAARSAPQKEKFAREHAAALEKKLSRLTIIVTSDAPDLVVLRDGQATSRASWGSAIAVDPGEHAIEARAPGKKSASFTVKVGPDGDKQTITINALETDPSAPAPPGEAPKKETPPSPPPTPPEPSYWTAGRVFGWSGVAAGSALVIGGVVLGFIANGKNNDAAANCPTDTTCNRDGLTLTSDARDFALGSTITISAGAGILAAGVAILLLWGPPRPTSAATR